MCSLTYSRTSWVLGMVLAMWIKHVWTFKCSFSCGCKFYCNLGKYETVILLDLTVRLRSFEETAVSSILVVPLCTLTSTSGVSVLDFPSALPCSGVSLFLLQLPDDVMLSIYLSLTANCGICFNEDCVQTFCLIFNLLFFFKFLSLFSDMF